MNSPHRSILQNGSALRPLPGEEHLLCKVENLGKAYAMPNGRPLVLFEALHFALAIGEILAIVGPSGVGKSSLLHILGALDRPSGGEVWFGGQRLSELQGEAAARFRNRQVGFVWQFHYLLPEFSAVENVAMPLLARGLRRSRAIAQAQEWLQRVGLTERAENRAGELSGGEQQRISLARALITKPRLLLADEPTGDLDGATADAVFDLLTSVHREERLTTVLVTHNMALARRCHRVLRLSNAGIEEVAAASV